MTSTPSWFRRAALPAVFSLLVSGCGVRTSLRIDADGAVPRDASVDGATDFGLRDGGADSGIDAMIRCTSDAECDDGLVCNGVDICGPDGFCMTTVMPTVCDDGVACTVDTCMEGFLGECVFTPDPSRCGGRVCDAVRGCLAVGCTSDAECENDRFCDGIEACGADGVCLAGSAPCPADACGTVCDETSRSCITPPIPVDLDGDGAGSTFCGGDDCNDRDARIFPGAAEVCDNGVDDDCSGAIDCRDPACAMDARCAACAPRETVCSGRVDEDCDDLIDCLDPDCDGTPACASACTTIDVCANGRDDDCDGTRDCDDTDCARDPSCTCGTFPLPDAESACADGVDEDCDGRTDCLDTDCATRVECDTTCGRDIGSRVGSSVARGNNARGTLELEGSCSTSTRGGREVRLVWTAPSTGDFIFDTFSSSFDTVLYVLASCTGPELPGACDDDGGTAQTSQLRISTIAGARLVIVIDAFAGVIGDYVLNIIPVSTTSERGRCRDGTDNDRDGRADCRDVDCASDAACCAFSVEQCSNGVDDDCDGFADCEDAGSCGMTPACLPDGGVSDAGVDAGFDAGPRDAGFDAGTDAGPRDAGTDAGPRDAGVDAGPRDAGFDAGTDAGRADLGMCTAREIGIAACTDGRDGDCDTRTDCADPDCRPLGAMAECCNGIDDDGDGTVDLFTCRCFSNADCAGVGDFEQVCWLSTYQVCAPRCNFVGGTTWCRSTLGATWSCNSTTGECIDSAP
jgi:hypothetical protein